MVETIEFSMYTIMSSVGCDSFSSSFPAWMTFTSFSCVMDVARTSSTMLNESGESRHSYLVPDVKGKAFSFCPLSIMLAVGFSYMAFIMLRYAPSISTLLSVFIKNGCWISSNAFFSIYWFDFYNFRLSFCLCDVLCLLICEYCNILESLGWIPLDHGVWSFFNVLLDAVCQYFVEDFSVYVHQRYWPEVFFLCYVLSGSGIRMMLAS